MIITPLSKLRPVGTRVYYTGDQANVEGRGTVVSHHPADRFYGPRYNIELDDGRKFNAVFPNSFDPTPGRRFWFLDDWDAERARQIERMQADMQPVISQSEKLYKAADLVEEMARKIPSHRLLDLTPEAAADNEAKSALLDRAHKLQLAASEASGLQKCGSCGGTGLNPEWPAPGESRECSACH